MKKTIWNRIKKILLVIFLPLIMLARLIAIVIAAYMISRGKPSFSYTEYEYKYGLKIWNETKDFYLDENGRVIKERRIKKNGDLFTVNTQYDSLGREIHESRFDRDYFILPSWLMVSDYEYYKDTELTTDRVRTEGSIKWEEHIEYDEEGNMISKYGNEFGVYGQGDDLYKKSVYNEKGVLIYEEFTDYTRMSIANYGIPVVTMDYDPETNIITGYSILQSRYNYPYLYDISAYERDLGSETQLTPDGRIDHITYYHRDYNASVERCYICGISQYEYDAENIFSGKREIRYDEEGNMIGKDVFDSEERQIFLAEYTDGAETLRWEKTYDPLGRESLYVEYTGGRETSRKETSYDSEGRETLYTEYTDGRKTLCRETAHETTDPDYPGEKVRIVRTYQQDENGEMILQEEERSKPFVLGTFWNPEETIWNPEAKEEYNTYYSEIRAGDKMRVSLESSFYDNGSINTRTYYEYDEYGVVKDKRIDKYDRHGSLIKQVSFDDRGNPVPTMERKYTYRN